MKKMRDFIMIITIVMIIRTKEIKCCLDSEKIGLLQINSSIQPNFLSSWEGDDCCDWVGIECNPSTGHVIGLDLSLIAYDNGEWYLNTSLFLPFPRLNRLALSNNDIAGCIHNEGFERLSTLTNLEFVDLSSNNFNNSILQSLSGLKFLKSLQLTGNKLSGTINISDLNNLTNTLQDLSLHSNQIEGFETMQVNLNKLEYLGLSENHLKSDSLSALSGLSSLKTLEMSSNQFKGPFNFTELNGLSNLEKLDLSDNQITNFIVKGGEGFPIFNKLDNLDLSSNHLNKTTNLIQSIGKLRSLTTLTMRGCGVSGNIQGLCDLEHLGELDLHDNNLNGDLPSCLSNLTSLLYLDLSSNRFTGNISSSPLKDLTSLQFVELSHNNFQIPISLTPFFNLSELGTLHADDNTLYPEIDDPNSSPKFQLLDLSLNGYSAGGSLPKFLYYQNNLRQVHISNLKLRGEFPYWLLQNNTKLEVLDLTNNSLSGAIQLPNDIGYSLAYLDISDNFFIDRIPSQIGDHFPRMRMLGMAENELEGTIPNSLCNFSALYLFDISQNNISGIIPKCIGNMSQLHILDLSRNNVSGSLPSNFNPSLLEVVNLSRNKLQGSLNDAFLSCIKLLVLDLSHNNFSRNIPLRIGELLELSFLVLGYNSFQGAMPIEFCKLNQLSFIDLSHNSISGHVLPCINISSAWSRQQVFLQIAEPLEITMKGRTYSYAEGILSYVTGIDISYNNLTGQIPSEIGYLGNVKALNLSHNSLTGSIPPSFSNLKATESLDLSYNNLQGPIPHQLTNLTSLAVFNVSYNNLSRQTPCQVAQFVTFPNSSYIGNPFLCGFPLSISCGATESNETSSSHDEKDNNDFIDMDSFYMSFRIAYAVVLVTLVTVLCINPYWRRLWFYYIQMSIENTCYFIIDNVFSLFSWFKFPNF